MRLLGRVQVTEVGKPDPYPDVDGPWGLLDGGAAAQGAAAPDAGAPAAGGGKGSTYVQQRSPLAGRCNLWNVLWSWSLKVRRLEGALEGAALIARPDCL